MKKPLIHRPEAFWAIEPRHFPSAKVANEVAAEARAASDIDRERKYAIQDGIAVIDIAGVMMKGESMYSWWFGSPTIPQIERQVRDAAADAAVNTILLRIDSPGGTVAGTSDLADAVFEARKQKPVIAYISDLGASAAYYVASQADRIYCDTDAMVGSIGVYLVIPDFSKYYEEEGIKIHVIRAGENKGAGTPGAPVTDAHIAEFQREVDQLNEMFVEAVSRGRGWTVERASKLNDGRVHVGRYAVDLGLVDAVKSFDSTMRELRAESLRPSGSLSTWRRVAAQA